MATKRIDIEAILKDAGSFEKMARRLTDADTSAKSLKATFRSMVKDIEQVNKQLRAIADGNKSANVFNIAKANASGGPQALIANSLVKGQIAKFEAESNQLFQKLTNSYLGGLRKFTKAVEQGAILELTKSRQNVAAGDRGRLDQQIEAQRIRAAQAAVNPGLQSNLPNVRKAALADLQAEENAAKRLEGHRARLVAQDQKLEQISKQRAAAEAKLTTEVLKGNRLSELTLQIKIKELAIQEALARNGGKITADINSQVAAMRRLAAERDKVDRTQKIANTRQSISDRLFGDGGAFLFKIQTQLLGNYLIINKLFEVFQFGKQFVIDLDRAFFNLQAITATTSTEMETLSQKLIDISTRTKFTAVQVAEAAVLLGQAGFSTREIGDSLESITLFATAAGTDLTKAVDLISSAMNVFNLQGREAANVANLFTAALNESKLDVDKLTLGLQYAGNIAATAGITINELTAALSAMANSGIRSGSILGTGLRHLITQMSAPTDKLQLKMRKLGLTLEDVNIETLGLAGAMKNLTAAGFGSVEAMEAFDIRAGAAFAALANNIGTMEQLAQVFLLSNAAAEANAIQMESLGNKAERFASIFGTFVVNISGPFVEALKKIIDGLSAVFEVLNKVEGALILVGTAALALGSAALIQRYALMVTNLLGLSGVVTAVSTTFQVAAAQATLFGRALAFIGTVSRSIGPLLVLTAVLTGAGLLLGMRKSIDELDKLRAAADQTRGSLDAKSQTLVALNQEIERLIKRTHALESDERALSTVALELRQRFGDLGAEFDLNNGKVGDFIDTLTRLRSTMLSLKGIELEKLIAQTDLTTGQLFRNLGDQASESSGLSARFRGFQLRTRTSPLEENASTAIQTALDRVGSGRSASGAPIGQGLTKADANSTLELFDRSIVNITRLQAQLEEGSGPFANLEGVGKEFITRLIQDVSGALEAQRTTLKSAIASQTQREIASEEAETNTLSGRAEIGLANSKTQKIARDLGDLRQKNREAKTAEEKEDLRVYAEQYQKTLEGVRADALKATADAGFSDTAFGKTDVAGNINALEGELKTFAEAVDEQRLELLKFDQETYTKELQQRITRIKAQINDGTKFRDIKAAEKKALDTLKELQALQYSQLTDKLRTDGQLGTAAGSRALSNLRRDQEDEVLQQQQFFIDKVRAFDKALEDKPDAIERFGKAITDATKALEIAKRVNAQDLNRAQGGLNATSLPQFRNQFSDVQRKSITDRLEGLKTQLLQRNAGSIDVTLKTLEKNQKDLKAKISQVELEQALEQEIVDRAADRTNNISTEEADASRKAVEKATKDLTSLNGDLLKSEQEIEKAQQDRIETLDELNARTGAYNEQSFDLMMGLREASAQYYEEIGGLKDFTTRFTDEVKGLFGALNSSFGTFVKNVVTGSESIGSSFKNLAIAIIEAMLDIAIAEVATGLFGFFKDALSGLGGGTTSTAGGGPNRRPNNNPKNRGSSSSGGIISAIGGFIGGLFNMGGYVRAAGGLSTRDSKMVLTRPGEYILRNSAVEAIGRENLDVINAMGDRAVSQSAPPRYAAPTRQPDSVNVWVVSPDNKPVMGPRDVVAVVTDNLANGGSIKKLVQQVSMGVS